MAIFYAFMMGVGGDIDYIKGFDTEAEVDVFAADYSSIDESEPSGSWSEYDPPVVLVFEVAEGKDFELGKYKRPVSIFQRGEKWVCVKPTESGEEA